MFSGLVYIARLFCPFNKLFLQGISITVYFINSSSPLQEKNLFICKITSQRFLLYLRIFPRHITSGHSKKKIMWHSQNKMVGHSQTRWWGTLSKPNGGALQENIRWSTLNKGWALFENVVKWWGTFCPLMNFTIGPATEPPEWSPKTNIQVFVYGHSLWQFPLTVLFPLVTMFRTCFLIKCLF